MKGATKAAFLIAVPLALAAPAASVSTPPVTADEQTVIVEGAPMFVRMVGSGNVTVILEAGSGGDHRTWSRVEPLLAPMARVVSYDRLDFGRSGRSTRPRTAAVAAEQLRDGLRLAGVQPPYLMVGHSYGGAITRVFAAKYPSDVMGLVLVDPAMEEFEPRAALDQPKAYLKQLESDLVSDDKRASDALKREYLAYGTSMLQTRLAKPMPGNRIVLLSAAKTKISEPLRRLWLAEQAKWASKVGARRIVVASGHSIHRERPDVVAAAVHAQISTAPRKSGRD